MGQPAALEVSVVAPDELGEDVLHAWEELEASLPVAVNPFLDPAWVLGWYELFVQPGDGFVVLVRQRKTGRLVGVAPVHVQDTRIGPLTVARRVLPVGYGAASPFELPGHLSAPGLHRDVTRALIETSMAMEVDWAVVSIAPEQGWLEPEQVMTDPRPASFWQHIRPRACVVLPLGATWEETSSGLKRNLKESLRRSRNRMQKSGRDFVTRHRTGQELDEAAVTRFLELHRSRSDMEQAGVSHPDSYADERTRAMMTAVLPRLAARGRASIFELELDGRVVAAQLALHATRSSYVHSSGFAPEVWDYGPVTHLVGQVVRHANERGDALVNFSPGPRVSKLRWSEELWVSNEFAVGAGSKALYWRYNLLNALRALQPHMSGLNWIPRTDTAGTRDDRSRVVSAAARRVLPAADPHESPERDTEREGDAPVPDGGEPAGPRRDGRESGDQGPDDREGGRPTGGGGRQAPVEPSRVPVSSGRRG